MKLSRIILRTLATEQVIAPDAHDVLGRILPIIAPLLTGIPGHQVDVKCVQADINDALGWNITNDVCITLIHKMARADVFESRRVNDKNIYFYKDHVCDEDANDDYLEELIVDFRSFATPLRSSIADIDDDGILDLLLLIIEEIDEYLINTHDNSDSLLVNLNKVDITNDSDRWKRTLVAKYVQKTISSESKISKILIHISELLLIREVVNNIGNVKTNHIKSNTRVLFDSPIVMDLLGTSGLVSKKNSLLVLNGLKEKGCALLILPTSVAEISRVLKNMLKNVGWDRKGPTARALRGAEVRETMVRDIANNPEKYINSIGITILPKNLESFPNEHKYFPYETYLEFNQNISWVVNQESCDHDAEFLTLIMRTRNGKHDRDFFKSSIVGITKNWSLARNSADFCLSKFFINEHHVPPIVNQRMVATLVWLQTGLKNADQIPMSVMLSSCDKIIKSNTGVIDKVRSILSDIDVTMKDEFELLIEDRDCLSFFTDKTLNDPEFIEADGILTLIDDMKKHIAKELTADHKIHIAKKDKEIKKLRKLLNKQKYIKGNDKNNIRMTDKKIEADIFIITIMAVEFYATLIAFGVDPETEPVWRNDGYKIYEKYIKRDNNSTIKILIGIIGRPKNIECATYLAYMNQYISYSNMILIGMAGGNKEKIEKLGDVVLASDVLDLDGGVLFNKTEQDNKAYKQPRITHHECSGVLDTLARAYLPNTKEIIRNINNIISNNKNQRINFTQDDGSNFNFKHGWIQSGDELHRDGSLPETSKKYHDKLYAVEMEGSGFSAFAKKLNKGWLIYRGISDFGDKEKHKTMQPTATLAAAIYAKDFIKNNF